MSDTVYSLQNIISRVIDSVSMYNNKSEENNVGPRVQEYFIKTSSLMQGFTVANYSSRFGEGAAALANMLQNGKLQYNETVTDGFDQTIDAFLDLFKGANTGKAIVKVSEIETK